MTNHWTDQSIRRLVFLGQVTEELTLRSPFIEEIGCGQIARDGEACYCTFNINITHVSLMSSI